MASATEKVQRNIDRQTLPPLARTEPERECGKPAFAHEERGSASGQEALGVQEPRGPGGPRRLDGPGRWQTAVALLTRAAVPPTHGTLASRPPRSQDGGRAWRVGLTSRSRSGRRLGPLWAAVPATRGPTGHALRSVASPLQLQLRSLNRACQPGELEESLKCAHSRPPPCIYSRTALLPEAA